MESVDLTDIEKEIDEAAESWLDEKAIHGHLITARKTVLLKDIRFHFRYLAEGGANVLFKIELSGAEHIPFLPEHIRLKLEALQGMLLRMRKNVNNHQRTNQQVMGEYKTCIKPLFQSKYMLQQKLVRLPRDTRCLLQTLLSDAGQNGTRLTKWQLERNLPENVQRDNDQLFTDEYGILIQDLSPQDTSEYLLEFKPKWLVASPSSPLKARRCRTCALRHMRTADGTLPGRGDSGFCPLDLLSGKAYILQPALRKLCNLDAWYSRMGFTDSPNFIPTYAEEFESEFRREVQPFLGRLRALQMIHRHVGLKDFETGAADEVSLAMALRDCSVFVKLDWNRVNRKITILAVKVADLDLKDTSPKKRETWLKMEQRLVEEGWYEDKLAPGIDNDDVICRLSRSCT